MLNSIATNNKTDVLGKNETNNTAQNSQSL